MGSSSYTTDEFQQAIDIVSSGKADMKKLIIHRFPLDEIAHAFEVQRKADEAVNVVIIP